MRLLTSRSMLPSNGAFIGQDWFPMWHASNNHWGSFNCYFATCTVTFTGILLCVARWTNGGLCCFVVCGVSRLLLIHFVRAGSMYRTYDGFVSLIHTWFFSLLLYTHWPHHRLNGQSKCFERCWDTKSRYHKHQNTVVIFTSQCMKRTSGTGCEGWSDFRKRSHRKKETDSSWQLFFMSYYYDYD